MKIVLILLLLIAVSFVAVMVYGVTRDEPARAETGKSSKDCGGPPPIDEDDPDEDALEDWCPPDFGAAVDWARLKFGPSLKIDRPEVALNGVSAETRTVPPAKDELRIARVALVDGRAARVKSQRLDGESESICLCRADTALNPNDFLGCKPRWLAKQAAEKCAKGSEGALMFGRLGGELSFEATRPARLVVK